MSSLPESLVRFRTDLEDAIRGELEAQATARSNGWGAGVLRAVRRRRGRTTVAFAAAAVAVVATLFVSTPWQSSPGFLERAQAALTPPEGSILHMKWKDTWTLTDVGCTVTRPHEVWIDQKSRQYRLLLDDPFREGAREPRAFCERGRSTEVGGISGSGVAYEFSAATRTLEKRGEPFFDRDPVKFLRDALSSGRAYDDGMTEFRGRPARRIRFTIGPCPQEAPECPNEEIHAYVDPETLKPAAIVSPHNFFGGRTPDSIVRFRWVSRYLIYEYLPRTAANLALTDIRAQHPDATGG